MRKQVLIFGTTGLLLVLMACGGTSAPSTNTTSPTAVSTASVTLAPTNNTSVEATTTIAPTEPAATALPTQAAQPTTEPGATQASNSGQGVPVGDIQQVMSKACTAFTAQPNVNVHITQSGDPTESGEMIYELVGNDQAHVITTQGGQTSEFYLLPTGYYNKEQDGTWKKSDAPASTFADLIPQIRSAVGTLVCLNENNGEEGDTAYEITGTGTKVATPEVVDDVLCLAYSVNLSTKSADETATGQGMYWLGKDDNLPRKVTLTYTGTKQDGTPVKGQATTTYSYQAANMQPPIP